MTRAITDDAGDRLFKPLIGAFPALLLAVSGGADSMAMMVLVSRWRERLPPLARPRLLVATFDHGLRTEAADEARWVSEQALQLGFEHRTLTWRVRKPATGIQAAARQARYSALSALAMEWAGIDLPVAILTGHHIEDQAETLIMRLGRGSGIDGLSCMDPVRWLVPGQVAIARPLLQTGKAELVATLRLKGVGWKEDPSNADTAFERVRVRKAAGELAELGLTPKALGEAAARIGRAREVIERVVEAAERRVLATNGGAYAGIARAGFSRLPEEVRVRILARVLFAFGGQRSPPGLRQVEELARRLDEGQTGLAVTLGGCLVRKERRQVIIHRELRRAGLPSVRIEPGESVEWDRRFRLQAGPRCKQAVQVAALADAEARRLSESMAGLPLAAARTLPAGWRPPGHEAGPETVVGDGICVAFTFPRKLWGSAGD